MTRRLAMLGCVVAAVAAAACASTPRRHDPGRRPPLVVVLVVDQMRAQYLDAYGGRFTGGLKRLMDEGAWFRRAAYPYLNTVTCPGHSTISTGALPYRHGMVLNAWWDRTAGRSTACTADGSARNLGYMGRPRGGDGAASMLVAPLGQQLREHAGGRAVALSLKARSAITMAGRDATAIVWFDESQGWTTSTAFTNRPLRWLQSFIDANPVAADRGRTWERLLPPAGYAGPDDAAAERPITGWTRRFPHVVGEPEAQFVQQWQRSPFADAYLGRMAAHAIDTLDLGGGAGTDFLSVSFSTLDMVGHQYGPDSQEVQDVLLRLDRTIGTLLDHLDARLGRDGYVLALSSDHGVATIPELSGGGRQAAAGILAAIDAALQPRFGPGKYTAHAAYTDIYLAHGVLDRLRKDAAATTAVLDKVRTLPGIAHAFMADDIRDPAARRDPDPVKRAAALSYYPARSGDIIVVPKEHWLLSTAATTHGTLYTYDQQVPLIFFGARVRRGLHDEAATPADIAPTLAKLAGAPFEATDGVARDVGTK